MSQIVLDQVVKSFHSKRVLQGVDLSIEKGEIAMLVGPSGAGKTTLMHLIGGSLQPDSGDILLKGGRLASLSDRDRSQFISKNLGLVFQSLNLISTLTVKENLAIPLYLLNHSKSEIEERQESYLKMFGLTPSADSYPAELSKGEEQLVCLARALIHEPEILIMDEPLSALDHALAVRVLMTLRNLVVDYERTLLMVAHDARIHPFAHRIVKMHEGRITESVGDKAYALKTAPCMRI